MMNIKRLREQQKLDQASFWNPVGISQSGGSRYEARGRIPQPVQMLLTIRYGTNSQRSRVMQQLLGK